MGTLVFGYEVAHHLRGLCERVKKPARMLGVNAPDDAIVAAVGQQGEPSQPVQGRRCGEKGAEHQLPEAIETLSGSRESL